MVAGIPYCQSLGIKILLSLGGQYNGSGYALTSVQDAEYMADFLWGAFGPLNSSANWPRPFDTEDLSNEVDGFDFDIEHVNTGMMSVIDTHEMLISLLS
jgi:chitinase